MENHNLFSRNSSVDIEVRRIYNPLQGDYRVGYYEIDLIERGRVEVYYGRGRMLMPPGSFFVASSDDTLYVRSVSGGDRVSVLQMRFSENYFPRDFLKLQMCASLRPFIGQIAEGFYGEDVNEYIQLHRWLGKMNDMGPLEQFSLLLRTMMRISRMSSLKIFPSMRWLDTANIPVDSIVDRANAYMKERISEPVRLAEMARTAGMTVPSFCRFYKKKTGMPPMSYLNKLRIEKACGLLESTDKPIKEIVAMCGYADSNFFIRVFKREMGMTMSQYRERKR